MRLRSLVRALIDVALVVTATLVSHLLLENFETSWGRVFGVMPYAIATGLAAIGALSICRLSQRIWRFASASDYVEVVTFVSVVVCAAVFMCFAFNRLEGVARSLPFLQGVLAVVSLIGARELHRLARAWHRSRKTRPQQFAQLEKHAPQVVLMVGVTPLTEVYLSLFETLTADKIFVAGILGRDKRDVGRLLRDCHVLGQADEIMSVLRDLGTHGIVVNRVIVTEASAKLTAATKDALREVVDQHDVVLQMAPDDLPFGVHDTAMPARAPSVSKIELLGVQATFDISPALNRRLAARAYWPLKRVLDVVLALILMIVLLPLYVLLAVICAIDVGLPVFFWQQRPGLGGRPFRVYKFRTMGASHTSAGYCRSDQERTSWTGRFIRRRRLDELPQLLAILTGKMSFVGPRPLLPVDQSHAVRCRLLIRPGLTGWAQVTGGTAVSPLDKAALDLWYIQNASLRVDIKILMKTGLVLFTGEQYQVGMIAEAWEDLRRSGIVRLSNDNGEARC